jgi:DNA-binding helix-hairpin-helix protein with protein kinase domain
MAPEIVRGEAFPGRDTDLYSLAVLLFYMLMVHHPLDGKQEASIRCFDLPAMNRLYGAHPVFIFDPDDDSNRPDPTYHRNACEYWPIYPDFLRTLFVRSFTDGLRDPQHGRVKETEWRAAMIRLRDSIIYCPHCTSENFCDSDTADASHVHMRSCWACHTEMQPSLRLCLGPRSVVMLNYDTTFYPHHLMADRSYDFSRPVAEVSRHPAAPGILGLKNLTEAKWVATLPDGAVTEVGPGRSIRLAAGTKINFGATEGRVFV